MWFIAFWTHPVEFSGYDLKTSPHRQCPGHFSQLPEILVLGSNRTFWRMMWLPQVTQLSQDLNSGLSDFKVLSSHITTSISLIAPNKRPRPGPRPISTRTTRELRIYSSPRISCDRYLFWTYWKKSWIWGISGSCFPIASSGWQWAAQGKTRALTLPTQPSWWTSENLKRLSCHDWGRAHHLTLPCLCHCQWCHLHPTSHGTEKA